MVGRVIVLLLSLHEVTAQIQTLIGFHVFGGTFQNGLNTAALCLSACQNSATCRAVDFNSNGNSCWFHFDSSVCGAPNIKTTCTHFKFVACSERVHIFGGTLQPGISTTTTCINACVARATCRGVDFNSAGNTCWFHGAASVCNSFNAKATCNHYRRVSCTPTTPTPTPGVVSSQPGFHILGGTLQPGITTQAQCITSCMNQAVATTCIALDFNTNGNTCWFHNALTGCGTLRMKTSCTHIKLVVCNVINPGVTPSPVTPAPVTPAPVTPAPVTPAPVTPAPVTPAPVTPAPTPGTVTSVTVLRNVAGATQQTGITTIAACVAACTGTCLAVDFSSLDNTCWHHNSATACNTLIEKAACTHIKLTTCSTAPRCGVPAITPRVDFRIVGGVEVIPNSWPWQVALSVQGSTTVTCGGSLLTNQWILTAAHCVDGNLANPGLWTARLGDHNRFTTEASQINATITQIIRHPSFNTNTFDFDIALLKLSAAITTSNQVSFACLPGTPIINIPAGTNCVVTGWGLTSENGVAPTALRQVNVPIITQATCRSQYGTNTITDRMVCAGQAAGGVDSCQGDSGGPLVCQLNGVWYQAGIVSFGLGCARPNLAGVYTRLSVFVTWVQQQINSN